jgi:hypothetical protein
MRLLLIQESDVWIDWINRPAIGRDYAQVKPVPAEGPEIVDMSKALNKMIDTNVI